MQRLVVTGTSRQPCSGPGSLAEAGMQGWLGRPWIQLSHAMLDRDSCCNLGHDTQNGAAGIPPCQYEYE